MSTMDSATSPTPSAEMEMKPCPFCGGASTSLCGEAWFYASCDDCEADGPVKEHPPEAIAAWNRRPSDPVRAELVEALEAEWEKWVDDLRVVYPDNEVLESFARLRDILNRAEAGSPRPTSTRRERQACLKCGTVTLDDKCHCSEVGGEPQFVNYADHLAAECNRLAQSPSRREVLEEAAKVCEATGDTNMAGGPYSCMEALNADRASAATAYGLAQAIRSLASEGE